MTHMQCGCTAWATIRTNTLLVPSSQLIGAEEMRRGEIIGKDDRGDTVADLSNAGHEFDAAIQSYKDLRVLGL